MHFQNGNLHWNIFFTRLVDDWKVEVISSFFELLYSHKVMQGDNDIICWIPSKRKKVRCKVLLSCVIHTC
jgi:hypothetical protein